MVRVLVFPNRNKVGNTYLELLTTDVPGVEFADWTLANALRGWDIVHLHWPETVWSTGSFLRRSIRGGVFVLLLLILRGRGSRIVETVHNVEPHDGEKELIARICRSMTTRLLHSIQVLDAATLLRLAAPLRALPSSVVPHGHYGESFPAPSRLAGPPFGIFHVGYLRPYKGTEELIECFASLRPDNWQLHVAGEVDSESRSGDLEQRLSTLPASFVPHFLEPSDVSALAGTCHLCVLPFRAIENSGSVVMALSLGLPVLAPDIGVLHSLQDRIGSEWIELYEPPLTPSILADALSRAEARSVHDRPDLDPLAWESIRLQLVAAYRSTLQSPAKTGAGRLQILARRGRSTRRKPENATTVGVESSGQSGGNE